RLRSISDTLECRKRIHFVQEIGHLNFERQNSSSVLENVSSVDNILKVLKEVDLSTVNKNLISEKEEALQKLGFYSGEEDMEFSSFSSETERAVKTWQASLGACEDGIMTDELLEKLFMVQGAVVPNFHVSADKSRKDTITYTVGMSSIRPIPVQCSKVSSCGSFTFQDILGGFKIENANGASVASVTEVLEIKQNVIKESEVAEFEASHHRVFLLGENRWEDSSRLVGGNKEVSASKVGISTTKCIACRGEGRILCTVVVLGEWSKWLKSSILVDMIFGADPSIGLQLALYVPLEITTPINVMELANQTLSRSFWNGLTREQNVHTVKVLATTFAMYVKGKHLSVHD
ncbi:hypothetical protein IFM89_010334, partial [Coptis chinensis]